MASTRILVIEDDPGSRILMSTMLSDVGYDVVSAADGDEAMRYLYSEDACDLVLSDIAMPGMSGVDFRRFAQDIRPGLPVILISGKLDAIASALKEGSLALEKPISTTRLVAVLEEALAQTKSPDA